MYNIMKFKNITNRARYYTYSSKAVTGRALRPGQTSGELDPAVLFNKYLIKDVSNGRTSIILTNSEKEYLTKLLSESTIDNGEKDTASKFIPRKFKQRIGPDGGLTYEKAPSHGVELDSSKLDTRVPALSKESPSDKRKETNALDSVKPAQARADETEEETAKPKAKVTKAKKSKKTTKPKKEGSENLTDSKSEELSEPEEKKTYDSSGLGEDFRKEFGTEGLSLSDLVK